jgi:hypothetical protein
MNKIFMFWLIIKGELLWKSTVGFWCQGIGQKFFRTFDTSFETKMMVKSGAIEIIFKSHKPFQSYLLKAVQDKNSSA